MIPLSHRNPILLSIVSLFILLGLVACQATEPVTPAATDSPPEVVAQASATPIPHTVTPAITATPLPTAVPESEEAPTSTAVPPTNTSAPSQLLNYFSYHGAPPSGDWDEANFDRFLSQNPDIAGTHHGLTLYGNPVPQSIHDRIVRDKPADVMSSYIGGNLRAYAEQGLIADISELWMEQDWHEQFPPSLVAISSVNGNQYFVPQAIQWNPIWYRVDIFADLGLTPPETWTELLALCDALNTAGIIPFAVSSTSWTPPLARWFTILNMRLNGPEFHERLMQGQERYDDPRVREVFVHWGELIARDCFDDLSVGYGTAAQQIFNGEAAMYNLGEWLSESYADGLPDTFDFFSFPVLNPELPHGEIASVFGAFMLSAAENPEPARTFLIYAGSAAAQETRAAEINQLVANLNADQGMLGDVYLRGREFIANADHVTELYEFNTHPDMARDGLSVFAAFFADPGRIDELLVRLEESRAAVYGSLDEAP